MFLPSSARAPAVLLAVGLLVLVGMLCFDASDLSRGESHLIALRADLRVLSSVITVIGAVWLAAVMQHDRSRQYTDARVTFTAARADNAIREGLAHALADMDTQPIRMHVVRGTATVGAASAPGETRGMVLEATETAMAEYLSDLDEAYELGRLKGRDERDDPPPVRS